MHPSKIFYVLRSQPTYWINEDRVVETGQLGVISVGQKFVCARSGPAGLRRAQPHFDITGKKFPSPPVEGHTAPVFSDLKLLTVEQIYNLNCAKFTFCSLNKLKFIEFCNRLATN